MYNSSVKGPHNAKWLGAEKRRYWAEHYAELKAKEDTHDNSNSRDSGHSARCIRNSPLVGNIPEIKD